MQSVDSLLELQLYTEFSTIFCRHNIIHTVSYETIYEPEIPNIHQFESFIRLKNITQLNIHWEYTELCGAEDESIDIVVTYSCHHKKIYIMLIRIELNKTYIHNTYKHQWSIANIFFVCNNLVEKYCPETDKKNRCNVCQTCYSIYNYETNRELLYFNHIPVDFERMIKSDNIFFQWICSDCQFKKKTKLIY